MALTYSVITYSLWTFMIFNFNMQKNYGNTKRNP